MSPNHPEKRAPLMVGLFGGVGVETFPETPFPLDRFVVLSKRPAFF